MNEVIKQLYQFEPQLRGKKLIVAVSGGVDSMVLLHGLFEAREQLELDLVVAHFEHGIRGHDSIQDAAFVEHTAQRLKLPFFLKCQDIPKLATGDNLEKVAREHRYGFFRELLADLQADWVLTAHHGDDNAETMLMNMIRGCGLGGLAGIRPQQKQVLRPLLGLSKQQLLAYAKRKEIAFREDATNKDKSYTRNRIRQELLPVMKEMNPNLIPIFTQMSILFAEDEDYLHELAQRTGYFQKTSYGCDISQKVMGEDRAVGNRVIYDALFYMVGRGVQQRMIEDIRRLMTLATSKKKHIKGEVWAHRYHEGIHLVREDFKKVEGTFALHSMGSTKTEFGEFVITKVDHMDSPEENVVYFSGDGELTVRARQEGDRMVPFGFHSPQKLKKLMNNRKVRVFARDHLPVILFNGEILFVAYVGRSNLALARSGEIKKITYYPKFFS